VKIKMNRFDLFNISERYIEILNPISAEKLLRIGEVLEFGRESKVIDFGCGFGETLAMWAEKFVISGTGVDIREYACQRARSKMQERKLADRIDIVCADGSEYEFQSNAYDAALCIGATFIWGGYRDAVRAMKDAIRPGGRLVIGEVHWLKHDIPQEYLNTTAPPGTNYEYELLQITNEEGFDIEYMVRAGDDDWDRYSADNWRGLVRWIDENPGHPERQEVTEYLHKTQEEYLKYEREYIGWAIYVLTPAA
jgi:cyclopropane fatty-acyl-phospholipid synthase-like methyltransferase